MGNLLFKRLSLLGVLLALCVVVLGAYVRLSDAGLGCPDWPGCYGTLTVPESEAAIQKAQLIYPNKPVETDKAWKEMAHRYLAGTLGFIVLALFALSLKAKQNIMVSRKLTFSLLLIILFQAMLGMWTVTMLLKPVIVSAHLIGGMATLGILTWIAHRHWSNNLGVHLSSRIRLIVRLSIVVVFGQVFLGGWTSTNYAALACTDFPTCHGVWLPSMDFKDAFHLVRDLGQSASGGGLTLASLTAIQWTHRLGALVVFLYICFLGSMLLKVPAMRKIALILMVVLIMQISFGVANLLLHLPIMLAVAHNFGATLLVITVVVVNSKITNPSKSHFLKGI